MTETHHCIECDYWEELSMLRKQFIEETGYHPKKPDPSPFPPSSWHLCAPIPGYEKNADEDSFYEKLIQQINKRLTDEHGIYYCPYNQPPGYDFFNSGQRSAYNSLDNTLLYHRTSCVRMWRFPIPEKLSTE